MSDQHIAEEQNEAPHFNFATEEENSAESQSEQAIEDQTQPDEGEENSDDEDKHEDDKVNLNDHPRWKEREDDWKNRFNDQETRHAKSIDDLKDELTQKFEKPTNENVPSWFGGDEAQWEEYQAYDDAKRAKAQQTVQDGVQAKQDAEQKAIEEATTYMDDEIKGIEADSTLNPSGSKIDRNKLLKFVQEEQLVDTKGQWNYKAGYKLMKAGIKAESKQKLDAKKQISNATISNDKATTDKPNFTTSEDFKNPNMRPW